MKKAALLILTAYSIMLSGCESLSQAIAPMADTATPAARPQAAPGGAAIPEECLKLVAGIKACERTGGFMEMGCKTGVKAKDTCPIPLDKLMQ